MSTVLILPGVFLGRYPPPFYLLQFSLMWGHQQEIWYLPNVYHKVSTALRAGDDARRHQTLAHCWQEGRLEQLPWKAIWQFPKRWKKNSAQDPAVPVLGIQSEELKTIVLTRTGHVPSAHSSITNNSKKMEATQMPLSWWVDNTALSFTMGLYLIMKECRDGDGA